VARRVLRVHRISLTVADLERSERFYREGLDFERVTGTTADDVPRARLAGIAGMRAEFVVLRLGAQEIELVAFDPPGRPYPPASTSADLWFQHFAIVVGDMARAYGRIRGQAGFTSISQGGPQQLPPDAGAVTAFKFRDPEGHPLELIHFPRGAAASTALRPLPGALFLGIDHSAIDVADTAESVDFYTRLLGLSVASRALNRGPEQGRLDGLSDPEVDVIALEPWGVDPPHIELLGYRTPRGRSLPYAASASDVATSCLVLEVQDMAALERCLREANGRFAAVGPVNLRSGCRATAVRDPDGHVLILTDAP
jgi:catechol 2,3-dioxygenase-like lactoylglutathione lyase family enzyme